MPYARSVSSNEFSASAASSSRVMSSAASSSSNCIGTVSFAGVERAAGASCAAGGGAGGGTGGGRGGSIGSAAASPVPEPSLDLASHVELERLVAGLLQRKRGLFAYSSGLRLYCAWSFLKWNKPPAIPEKNMGRMKRGKTGSNERGKNWRR